MATETETKPDGKVVQAWVPPSLAEAITDSDGGLETGTELGEAGDWVSITAIAEAGR